MTNTLTTSEALNALEAELERLVTSARHLHESAEAAGQASEAAAGAVGAARSATQAANLMTGQVEALEETLAALAERLDSGVTERLNLFGEEVRNVSEAVAFVRAGLERQDFPAQFARLDAGLNAVSLGVQNTTARLESVERNVMQDAAARQAAFIARLDAGLHAVSLGVQNAVARVESVERNVVKDAAARAGALATRIGEVERQFSAEATAARAEIGKLRTWGGVLLVLVIVALAVLLLRS